MKFTIYLTSGKEFVIYGYDVLESFIEQHCNKIDIIVPGR